ncbi:MAG: transcriptional repressor LexA [Candidatus Omnitrophica bacterium]|nr:transcriptional repressor LexA [Candidatus Omnitrophota bacterium]
MPEPLTKRQKQIFNYLTHSIQQEGYPPSIREIGEALGIKSPRGVVGHLEALEKKGYLSRERGARTIKIKSSLGGRFPNRPQKQAGRFGENVPVLGAIAAGSPILAEENLEDHLLVDERFASGKNIFALKVKGESMLGAGILPGDYVLVRQQLKVENGEIAAVLLDDEATVKRVHCSKTTLRLVSENPAMAPIEVRENEKRVQILGKIVGVMRKL